MSSSELNPPVFVFVCDSRGNNFDKYTQPDDLNIHYIIRRGYDVNSLQSETLKYIESISVNPSTPVFVKIAAGINDILNKIANGEEWTAYNILDKLIEFRERVRHIIPWAQVGFITIPTVEVHLLPRLHNSPHISNLSGLQDKINKNLELLNRKIRSENSLGGCWTVSWHLSVQKKVSKRSGKGRKSKQCFRFMYQKLYDGLHGVSDVKKFWFNLLIKSFRGEYLYVSREKKVSHENYHDYEDIISSEHFSDFETDSSSSLSTVPMSDDSDSVYIPWKRR